MYGIFALDWEINLITFNLTVLTCLVVQAIGIRFTTRDMSGLKSAFISALSLTLMMHANSVWTMMLAGVLSIGSKYLIRWKGKHIFNPTNFGIMVTILLTHDAWISPGQWGSNALLLMLVGCAGLVVLLRVKRLGTALAFLLTFLGLSYIRNILYLGWPNDFFWHQLSTGSLLLFTFFMITDPMASPSHRIARLIWGSMVGVLAYYISTKLFVHTAPLWALFLLSPLVPVFDRIFRAEKFSWKK